MKRKPRAILIENTVSPLMRSSITTKILFYFEPVEGNKELIMEITRKEYGLGAIGIFLSCLILAALCACTTVNIRTAATIGENTTSAKVDGSAWAEVNASSVATKQTAASTAGRSHPVSANIVDTARVLGVAGIAAGVFSGNVPLAAGGVGAVAGSYLPSDDADTTETQ